MPKSIIKYNPFKASSIITAILMYLVVFKKDRKDINFKIDVDDFVDGPLKLYQKYKEEARRDQNFIKYPPQSLFRSSKENKVIWSADQDVAKDWKKEESDCVCTAIVGLYGNLLDKNVLRKIITRVEGPLNPEATYISLVNQGRTLIEARMDLIQQDKTFQNLVLGTWNQKVMEADEPVGEAAPKEGIETVEDLVMEVMLKDLKKSEICDKLDELGVEYNRKDKKAVLLDLLEKSMPK